LAWPSHVRSQPYLDAPRAEDDGLPETMAGYDDQDEADKAEFEEIIGDSPALRWLSGGCWKSRRPTVRGARR